MLRKLPSSDDSTPAPVPTLCASEPLQTSPQTPEQISLASGLSKGSLTGSAGREGNAVWCCKMKQGVDLTRALLCAEHGPLLVFVVMHVCGFGAAFSKHSSLTHRAHA